MTGRTHYGIVAGVDIGSLTAKTVLLDEAKRVVAHTIVPTGAVSRRAAQSSLQEALDAVGLPAEKLNYVIATGYGRANVPFANVQLTEISCHARGVHFVIPEARTIIDIGGQDSKVISLDENDGRVISFVMNDKCAAGSGRFLEVMSRALEVELEEMGPLSLRYQNALQISSTCTVFAESEVVALIAANHDKVDIIAGIHKAIARRVASMVKQIGVREKVVMTGGVAKNIGAVRALEDVLGVAVYVPEEPQITGALGAALFALEGASASLRIGSQSQKIEREQNGFTT